MSLQSNQEMVIVEHDELLDKTQKLEQFLNKVSDGSIQKPKDYGLMLSQLNTMKQYVSVLKKRIDLF